MAKYAYAKREFTSPAWLAPIATAAVVFFPLSLKVTDYRSGFATGLKISAHKSSPAYAAFEDLRENYAPPISQLPDNGIMLKAGTKFEIHPQSKGPRQIRLAGLTIRLPAREKPTAYVAASAIPSGAPIQVKTGYGTPPPLAERRRQILEELQREDWTLPTVASKARELAEAELNKTAKSTYFNAGAKASVRLLPANSPTKTIIKQAANMQEVADQVSDAQTFGGSALTARAPDTYSLHPVLLSGNVEVTGGLAFVGPETRFAVKRVYNGQSLENGRIWVSEGRFEIRVKEPTGFLVAQLQATDGRVLGEGEINLLDISNQADHGKVADIRIALHPTSTGATFRTISSYAGGAQRVAVADAKVEIQAFADAQKVNAEGIVSDPSFSYDSTFVARAFSKKRWPSLFVGQARVPQEVRLFEKSTIDALISLNSQGTDRAEAFRQSVVWGQVRQDGKALTHAQVELAGEYKPIYFNEAYLPDPKLNSTSVNGLFAFIKVNSGTQALRVRFGSTLFPAQIFPTEDRHVSYVDIDVRGKVTSQFKIFDPLDADKLTSARVRLVGTEDSVNVNKDSFVAYRTAANPFLIEGEAGPDYEVSRATISGTPREIYLPMVRKSWLFQHGLAKNIAPRADRGTVVGYVDESGYEIEMTGYPKGEGPRITYFDSEGKAVTSKFGVNGGGFIIYNAPTGMQTVVVHAGSRQQFSQVVVPEPGFVQVITH